MKASVKFRSEQKPLLRGKIPLTILNFPFRSGFSAGDSKELCLNLSTFFESGPSIKLSYRPNDPKSPFGLIFKTGMGPFGSPNRSPLTMSAEFNLVGNQNPRFFIHFKPNLGDFTLKKSHASPDFVKRLHGAALGEEENFVNNGYLKGSGFFPVTAEENFVNNGYLNRSGFFPATAESKAAAAVVANGLIKGMELSARTAVPLRDFAVVNFRWGLRFPPPPAAVMGGRGNRIRLPLLAMNKIGIEYVAKGDSKEEKLGPAEDRLAKAFLEVKKQLVMIQAENGLLSKAMGDLRAEIAAGKMDVLSETHRNKYSGGGADCKGNAFRKPSEVIREGIDGSQSA